MYGFGKTTYILESVDVYTFPTKAVNKIELG